MIQIKLTILLSFIYLSLLGQNKVFKAIDMGRQASQLNALAKVYDSATIILDSIEVSIKDYGDRIETRNIFKKSKAILNIDFYINGCQLFLARVKQRSSLYSDLSATLDFCFESDSIFYLYYHRAVKKGCIAIPIEISTYNQGLSELFIKNYIRKLYAQIKNTPFNVSPLAIAIN